MKNNSPSITTVINQLRCSSSTKTSVIYSYMTHGNNQNTITTLWESPFGFIVKRVFPSGWYGMTLTYHWQKKNLYG